MMGPDELDARLYDMVKELLTLTRSGTVSWSVSGDASFSAIRSHGSVVIRSRDGDGRPPYEFLVLDASGIAVAELETSSFIDELGDRTVEWEDLIDLYAAARQSAFDVDQIIDDLTQDFRHRLAITKATYGANEQFLDVTARVTEFVQNDMLRVRVTNEMAGGDPVPQVTKILRLDYDYDGVAMTKEFREDEEAVLP